MPDDLLTVPPAGPTVSQQSILTSPTEHAPAVLGTRWLKFWNYFSLPVGGLLSILLFFRFSTPYYAFFFLAYLHFLLAYGLHHRRLWAWQWNWVMVVLTWIGGAIPLQFSSALDLAVSFFIRFVIFGVVWMWPNYVYWKKRRNIFKEETREGAGPDR